MICPACSAAEITSDNDVCDLCGFSASAHETAEGKAGAAGPARSGADAQRTTTRIPRSATAGQATAITVTAKDRKGVKRKVGGDTVVVAVTGSNAARPRVADVGNGTYTATYTPTEVGKDLLVITLNGVPVRGSPFAVKIAAGSPDPSQSTATVPSGLAGKITAILVTARDTIGNELGAGGAALNVSVGGTNAGAEVVVTDNGDGTYTANYTPTETGTDEVTVTIDGEELGASPYSSVVTAGFASAADSTATVPAEGTAGKGTKIVVRARDAHGNALTAGGDKVFVRVSGANAARPRVTDVGNGSYTATYTPTATGTDSIGVTLDGKHVAGSPFTSVVRPGPADPSQTTVSLPSCVAGEAATIVVTASDARGNPLDHGGEAVVVRLRGANRITPEVEDRGDSTYTATCTPTKAGGTEISVTLDGRSVAGSPFSVTVEPGPAAPAKATVTAPRTGTVGEVVQLNVTARDAHENRLASGGDVLEVEVSGVNASAGVVVTDRDDGTYGVTYTPTQSGTDEIAISMNGEPLPDSPVTLEIVSGSASTSETLVEVPDGRAGEPTEVVVRTRDAHGNLVRSGGRAVAVEVGGANEGAAVEVRDAGDGSYLATYVPRAVGADTIRVSLDGAPVAGGPHASQVVAGPADPKHTVATLPSTSRAGTRTNLFVTTADAFGNRCTVGGDEVAVVVEGANAGLDVPVTDNGDGTYLAQLTPTASGEDEVRVTVNGKALADGSLVQAVTPAAIDPHNTTVTGPTDGLSGEPLTVLVATRDKYGNEVGVGGADIDISVTGANDGAPLAVKDLGDGNYSATYVPKHPGRDRIAVTIGGRHVGGEPLRPTITVGGVSARSTADVPDGRAGKVSTITITARDGSGNEVGEGGARVAVAVSVANSAKPPVIDHGDGTYTAGYTPTSTGTDYIAITVNGQSLIGSPFKSLVSAGPTDAGQTTADVPPSGIAGHPTTVRISARDVHGNEVTHGGQRVEVVVSGANDDKSLQVRDLGDGTFTATYTPTVAGRDHIGIFVGGQPVGGGEFTTVVHPDVPSPAQTTADFPPGTVGNMTTITVTLRDAYRNQVAGRGDLNVLLGGANEGAALQMTDHGDGTYTATYLPTIAGTDTIRVFVAGAEIREGTISGLVSAGRAASDRTAALVPDGVAGGRTVIALTARDAYGNALAQSKDIDVVVQGANDGAAVAVADLGDGTYEASYRPTAAGIDQISIDVNGRPIRGGPFTSTVEPAEPDPSRCVATLPKGTVGVSSTISVMARDAFDNDVTTGGGDVDVQVTGANVGTTVHVMDRGNGTYAAVYTPIATGTDVIAITLNGEPISGSPFAANVVAGRIEAAVAGRASYAVSLLGERLPPQVARPRLRPTVMCPRCSVVEISPETNQCELCGLVLGDALTPKRATRNLPKPVTRDTISDIQQRVERELGERFTLQALLRRGDRSYTYTATDAGALRRVALKVFERKALSADQARQFEEKIEGVSQLTHAHFISVLEHGATESFLWYSSEYIPGQPLADVLQRAGRLDVETCMRWVEQIAAALDHMHRRGIVHGNLKPTNVIIDSDRWARIGDPLLMRPESEDELVDAPEYLAPEQFGMEPVAAGADQFSLALLAYEGLAGKHPYRGKSVAEVVKLHVAGPPPVLGAVRDDVPIPLSEAVRRAMHLKPGDRFPRISEFVEHMSEQVEQVPLVFSQPRLGRAPDRPRVFVLDEAPRRFPSVAVAIGAIVVLAAAGALQWLLGDNSLGWMVVDDTRRVTPGAATAVSPPPEAAGIDDSAAGTPGAATAETDAPGAVGARDTGVVAVAPEPEDPAVPAVVPDPETVAPETVAQTPPDSAVEAGDSQPETPTLAPISPFGMLTVTSTPSGRLFIDGRPMGSTPRSDIPLDPGTHIVRIVLINYEPYETEIAIEAGETLTLPDVVLQPRQE